MCRDAESAAEKIGVDAVEAGESLERGVLLLQGGVGEGDLILLREAGFLLGFLAGQFVGEIGEARGVAGARDTIVSGLLEGIEGTGEGSLRLGGDGGLGCGAVARIVEDVLILCCELTAERLLLAEQLLIECVCLRELLVGEFAGASCESTATKERPKP